MGNDRYQVARRRELEQIRSQLLAHVQQVYAPEPTAQAVREVMEKARAWYPMCARELHAYLTDHPDALTAPSPHCPRVLARLLRQLVLAGYGSGVVTPLACVRCGRSDRYVLRPTSEGRACYDCCRKIIQCARCHRTATAQARRPEGAICGNCYTKDPLNSEECAICHRIRPRKGRREDGSPLCGRCAPRPMHTCARCQNLAPAQAMPEEGPVCRACYESPPRQCGQCGKLRPIAVQARGGEPDICVSCHRGPLTECTACGRVRHCYRATTRGGAYHCRDCFPSPPKPCSTCGNTRKVSATWPRGVLCANCYLRWKNHPAACARCSRLSVLVGNTPDGDGLCGPCAGAPELTFTCQRCHHPGDTYRDRCCARCIVSDLVHGLLQGPDGAVPPRLRPLADALIGADVPRSVLCWARTSPSAKALTALVRDGADLTHARLDELPQRHNTRYICQVLVATGILPQRAEELHQLQLWARATLASLPPHQQRLLRPFAEWSLQRSARRRSASGRYTRTSLNGDRNTLRVAIQLLAWLDDEDLRLSSLTQLHMERWIDGDYTRSRHINPFIRWTNARRITSDIALQQKRIAQPSQFIPSHELHDQLRRCLNDDTLPLDVRIVDALIRLYALPVTRILQLKASQYHRDGDNAFLTIS